ncbi:MAG: carboxypeptidase-like regulatory domain-containing protein [Terracidiphilus sp.]|jgi:hypothetical protein
MRFLLILLLFTMLAVAQQDGVTGTVSGQVYCADTQHPARLAHVALVPLPLAVTSPSINKPHTPQQYNGDTRSDGSFIVTHVPPGDYYVSVTYPGYLTPEYQFSADDLLQPSADARKRISEVVPVVTVGANRTASVSVDIHRGAAIFGTLRYDDGSPIPDAEIVPLRRNSSGSWTDSAPPASNNRLFENEGSDDLGHFRIQGLAPGEYTLKLPRAYDMGLCAVYYGDVFLEKDAKSIKLTDGEEYPDADITIRLSKLHTVSGSLVNSSGQPINSGKVTLYTAADNIEIDDAFVSEEDATFYIDLVPDGTYTLRVTDAKNVNSQIIRDLQNPNVIGDIKRTTLATYADYQTPLEVTGDITGLTIAVPDKRVEAAQPTRPSR